jgi:type II secretion system protein H
MMRRAGAFTLVELVLVMALLCLILGIAAPSLARSMHQRNLTQEATRLLALTEYARDEAVSLGVPMMVWIDVKAGRFGVNAMPGYEDAGARTKEYTLIDGLHFDPKGTLVGASGRTTAAEFNPDGALDISSQAEVRVLDRSDSGIEIAQTSDGSGYEITKETP